MPPPPSTARFSPHRGEPRAIRQRSGRLDLRDCRRVAGDGGAPHVADLALVETAHPMHHLPVVPHDEVVLPPAVDIDELRLYRIFRQIATPRPGFGHRPADDRAGMRGQIE